MVSFLVYKKFIICSIACSGRVVILYNHKKKGDTKKMKNVERKNAERKRVWVTMYGFEGEEISVIY